MLVFNLFVHINTRVVFNQKSRHTKIDLKDIEFLPNMDVKKELNATPLPQRAQNANAGGPKVAANAANAQQINKNNVVAGGGQQQNNDKKPPFNKGGPPNKRRFGNQNNNRNNGGGRPGGRRNDVSVSVFFTLIHTRVSAILNLIIFMMMERKLLSMNNLKM